MLFGNTTSRTAVRTLLHGGRRFWQKQQSTTKPVALATTLGWTAASTTLVTLCDSGNGSSGGNNPEDWLANLQAMGDQFAAQAGSQIQSAVDSGIPTQLSYGFVMGYCSGYAMKKVGRAAAGVLGLGFMSLQTLSYMGYVHVDHVKMKGDIETLFDLNKDGKVDNDDAKLGYEKVMEVLAFNLPAGGGFGAGFLGGLRTG